MIVAECGMLMTAVLRRDKLAVEKILDQNPKLLETERNVFGHSAIHLAIGWPDGLELLLRTADESLLHRDTNNIGWHESTPLDYAIAFGCTDSIRLLADADVAFNFEWNLFVGTNALRPHVSELVLDIILERFQQLLEFGEQKLPAEMFSSLQITGLESFDLKARALLNCLHEEAIQLPRKFSTMYDAKVWYIHHQQDFWLPFGGLFHQAQMCRATAMTFFQAGFTNIDAEVEQITPLMNLSAPRYVFQHQSCFSRYFRIVEFFVEKGGQLDRQIPSIYISASPRDNHFNNYRVIHRIAYFSWIGVVFFPPIDAAAVAGLGTSQIWHNILQSNTSDPCICACSSGGCRPISLALRSSVQNISYFSRWYHFFHDFGDDWREVLNTRHWKAAVELLTNLTYLLNGLDGEQLVEDVIRFLTFSGLGLTHTCCRHLTSRGLLPNSCYKSNKLMIRVMNPTDVEEIRDEEGELIEKLDLLVDRFMKEFHELGVPLSQFLLKKWQETMFAELTEKVEVPETVIGQLDELGVTLCVDSSLIGEDESDKDLDEPPDSQTDYWKVQEQEDGDYDEWMAGIRKSIIG
jgi:hypothetical protein